jgi:hypothetical protein
MDNAMAGWQRQSNPIRQMHDMRGASGFRHVLACSSHRPRAIESQGATPGMHHAWGHGDRRTLGARQTMEPGCGITNLMKLIRPGCRARYHRKRSQLSQTGTVGIGKLERRGATLARRSVCHHCAHAYVPPHSARTVMQHNGNY